MRPSHVLQIVNREFVSTAAAAHTPVMLWGPPGVGKSQLIAQIARSHGGPLIDVRLSQMEPTDLRGIPFRSRGRLDPRGPWEFESWETIVLPREIGGGGGTRFMPVFDWIAHAQGRPDLLLYFTDAEGEFPRHAPAYPVILLVKGRGRVPWGERIQLN